MSEKLTLLQKLVEIRKSIGYAQKTMTGNQGAKYVDTAVLLKKVRDKMDELNVLLIPSLSESTIANVSAPTKNNKDNLGFLFSTVVTYSWACADSGEKLNGIGWFATGSHLQDPAMAQGGGLTFSERYFILKFFQVPTATDDPEWFESKTAEKISVADRLEIESIITGKGYSPGPVLVKYCMKIANIDNAMMLPLSKLEEAKAFFNNMDPKK